MKKTLIASAVAAATLSSTAFAMDQATDLAERLDSMPTIYGNIQLAWTGETVDDGTTETSTNEMGDNGSTIGFSHTHVISDGVEGFFKAEFHFDADEGGYSDKDSDDPSAGTKGGLGEKLDEAYIGVKGDFGSIQAGTDDTVYEWVDMLDTGEAVYKDGALGVSESEGDNIQYVSPDISGLKVGVTVPVDSDTQFGGGIAAQYSMDSLTVALGYTLGREEKGDEAGDVVGIAASYGIDDLTLIAQYESKSEDKSGNVDQGNDQTLMGLRGIYSMGQNQFALGYIVDTTDKTGGDIETSYIDIQALHNLSDNMYVYLEYQMSTKEESGVTNDVDTDTLALGATYAF